MTEANGTNGKVKDGSDLKALLNRYMTGNAMLASRAELFRQTLDPRRDIDVECGYPKGYVEPHVYQDLFDREAIATRVVEVWPKETWKVTPEVYEIEDSQIVTPFEEAWDALGRSMHGEESFYQDEKGSPVWEMLLRADVLSGIGSYGIILLNLDDGKDLDQSAEAARKGRGKDTTRGLVSMRAFPESLAPITQFEADRSSSRFGQPVMYSVTFNDPSLSTQSGIGQTTSTVNVHWTRVVHLADNRLSSEIFGVPRMRPVLNRLLDLTKIYGADGEGFWRNGILKLFLETHPEMGGDVEIDTEGLKDSFEDMMNGLQQWMTLRGMSAKSVPPAVSDPTPHLAVQIEAICIQLQIPVPVFKGYEIGEQASTNNDSDWNDRVAGRQNTYCTPRIIVPMVDRLINLGVLPEPGGAQTTNQQLRNRLGVRQVRKRGRILLVNQVGRVVGEESEAGYSVVWPDLGAMSESEKASIAATRTNALAQYGSSGLENLITPLDYLTRVYGLEEGEAQTVLENTAAAFESSSSGEGVGDTGGGGSPLLGLVGGITGMLEMFKLAKEGGLSEEQLKQQIMLFYKVSEEVADAIIADGIEKPEPPPPPPFPPGGPQGGPPEPDEEVEEVEEEEPPAENTRWVSAENAFCATGEGGGIDPSCSPKGGGGGGSGGSNSGQPDLLKQLAPAEKKALRDYMDAGHEYVIMKQLASGFEPTDEEWKLSGLTDDKYKPNRRETAAHLKTALGKIPQKVYEELYRGDRLTDDDLSNLKVGSAVVFPTIASFSTDPKAAVRFAHGQGTKKAPNPVKYIVEGGTGRDMSTLVATGKFGKKSEKEVLMDPGSRFTVKSISTEENKGKGTYGGTSQTVIRLAPAGVVNVSWQTLPTNPAEARRWF